MIDLGALINQYGLLSVIVFLMAWTQFRQSKTASRQVEISEKQSEVLVAISKSSVAAIDKAAGNYAELKTALDHMRESHDDNFRSLINMVEALPDNVQRKVEVVIAREIHAEMTAIVNQHARDNGQKPNLIRRLIQSLM